MDNDLVTRIVLSEKNKMFDFKTQEEPEFPCVVPASCNWYCTSILSCLNGFCAIGGKNVVYVFNLQQHPPVCEWDMGVSPSLNIKVTSVSLVTTQLGLSFPDYIAVGLEDGLVRVISTTSKTVYKEHRKHMIKISAMSCVPLNQKIVLSGDIKGNLSVWNYEENSVQLWNPNASSINCMQLSDQKNGIFVVGYQNGNIIVADHNKLEVLLNLKSHLDEITSLSWCPGLRNGKICFVSGSKDHNIRVWEINSEKCDAVYNLPKRNFGKKRDMTRSSCFPAVLWINEKVIACGLQSGEVLCWDDDGKTNIIGAAHERVIFSMCCDALTNQFVSVSMDRQIIVWNGHKICPSFKIPTLGGFVYSLSTAINNPYAVAMGVGDNMIRVLSSNISAVDYNCSKLWEGIKSKVTVLSFHPSYDGIIGYGTDDGHVGCYSMNSHKSEISATYHKKVVYSLSWSYDITGDVPGDNLKVNCLYTVGGEGAVLMHKMGSFNTDACNIGYLIKKKNDLKTLPMRSDLSWMHDYSHFSLANSDGSIDLFSSKTVKLVASATPHKKAINCTAWHHNFSYSNEGGTMHSAWLASGSNEDAVCVTDFTPVMTTENEGPQLLQSYRQLLGHSGRVTNVVWNPHKNGILASSSFDGSVQIWDVLNNTPLANFSGHIGRVYSVLWSHLDPDIVYSGGEDFSLRRWKISELSESLPPAAKKNKSKKKKRPNKENCTVQVKEELYVSNQTQDNTFDAKQTNDHKESSNVLQTAQKYSDVARPQINAVNLMPDVTVNVVPRGDQKGGDGGRKKKVKSVLKMLATSEGKKKELLQEDCISLAKYLKESNDNPNRCVKKCSELNDNANIGFYTSRSNAYELLGKESENHEERGSFDQLIQLELWRNNIAGLMDKAVDQSFLNETLVALSPLGGYDMWKAAMLAYAEQLEKRQKYHQAALYFVAIGDVHKAVNLLKDNGHFKEALILAKVQLSSDDPLINELYMSRGKKLLEECNYEQAAECYLAAGSVEEAVNALAKRGDASSFHTALQVADIYGLNEVASTLLKQTVTKLYQEKRWNLVHKLLPRLPTKEVIHFQVIVAESLMDRLYSTDIIQSIPSAVENHKKHGHDIKQTFSYPTCIESKLAAPAPSFLMKILHAFEIHCGYTKKTAGLFKHINFTKLLDRKISTSNIYPHEVFDQLTKHILVGIVSLIDGDGANCFKNWLLAFSLLEQCGFPAALLGLFNILLPNDYSSFTQIIDLFKLTKKTSQYLSQFYRNFHAFKCTGIIYLMWYKIDEFDNSETIAKELSTDVIEKVGSVYKLISMMEQAEHYCSRTNSHSVISYLSSVLLSSVNISHKLLVTEVECINQKLLELDIKRRLNEHIFSRQDKTSKTDTNRTERTAHEEVSDLCCHMVNTVMIIEKGNIYDLCIQHSKSGDHENVENRMLTAYLNGQKSLLMKKLEGFSSDIKDIAFPSSEVSWSILMLLLLKYNKSHGSVNSLLKNISSWGEQHGIYIKKKSYIKELIKKCV